jgi:tRNA (guanine37-N1)-methyltransferase
VTASMRVDVVTIFPDYLAPLELSLIGKARRDGLLDLRVQDLRDFTHDRHRTVDDTPYGGGAGMVMRPEPWGEALDAVVGSGDGVPHLVVPSPAGEPFTQRVAERLAAEPWLAFACGRYEGIDERVVEDAATRMPVSVISLGDYVLNGGEVAVLAIVEAVARLLPGVLGNAASLLEESHEDGLLEYPVYTKPPVWRGREVPPVLLSGDHGAIATWRHQQRVRRTAERRPDLRPASAALAAGSFDIQPAQPSDAEEIAVLQRACWITEALANRSWGLLETICETPDEKRRSFQDWHTWVVRSGGRLVGSVRARASPEDRGQWEIGRLMVAPDLHGRGIGRALLEYAEAAAPAGTRRFWVNTGAKSTANLRRYRRAGYRVLPGEGRFPKTVDLVKDLPRV